MLSEINLRAFLSFWLHLYSLVIWFLFIVIKELKEV
jgi:hypothetical protein